MRYGFRWFGPGDAVTLDAVRQAGASIVVTSLHDIPPGEAWPVDRIRERQALVSGVPGRRPLEWRVVESLPVAEAIKTGEADRDRCIDNYIASLKNLAASGIHTVCYNFMPVLDWTRTDLARVLPDGSRALVYDHRELAAFDLFVVARKDAASDYSETEIDAAERSFSAWSEHDRERITHAVLKALPGESSALSVDGFRSSLNRYEGVSDYGLRENLAYFLRAVAPAADEAGVLLCIHPDDPPFSIFGLPRIVSTADDLNFVFDINTSISNGLTLCTGSLGARSDNDVVRIAGDFANRIHFAHLRSTRREDPFRFYEADHLEGDVDMYAVVRTLVLEEARRKEERRPDAMIPIRPDHGHEMLDDIGKPVSHPGYSAIGRLRGLAEIRGLELGIRRSLGMA